MLRASASDCPRSSAPEAGIGARRVDQGDDRGAELGGELHQPERLAVALGVGHAEVALEVLLGVAALLVADDHHGHAGQPGPAADHRGIVEVEAVAVQLDEVGEDGAEVVQRVGAAGVAGDHDPLDRGQVLGRSRRGATRACLAGLPVLRRCRSAVRSRCASGRRSAAPAPGAASRTPAYRLRPSGSSRLDVVDGIGAQQVAQGAHEILLRRDADAAGPEPDRLPVAVAPLNIERRGTRVSGAERGGLPGAAPAAGPREPAS